MTPLVIINDCPPLICNPNHNSQLINFLQSQPNPHNILPIPKSQLKLGSQSVKDIIRMSILSQHSMKCQFAIIQVSLSHLHNRNQLYKLTKPSPLPFLISKCKNASYIEYTYQHPSKWYLRPPIPVLSYFLRTSPTLKKKWSQNGSTLELFWKTAPLFKSGAVFYLNGGHPVDMKTAPPWSHFGSTFFFQCSCLHYKKSTLDYSVIAYNIYCTFGLYIFNLYNTVYTLCIFRGMCCALRGQIVVWWSSDCASVW